ncbi:putative leucine-rich repeat domain superfamily [Helianthus annuus]|nr:putative leucine-rich repeat domain superfamily [Helianthus annuus]
MTKLDEVIFADNELSGCLPDELGLLENITILDVSENNFVGTIPEGFGKLKGVEMIDIRKNELTARYLKLEPKCEKPVRPELVMDYRENCLPKKPDQKSEKKCEPVVNREIDCESVGCKSQVDSDEESKKKKTAEKTDTGS